MFLNKNMTDTLLLVVTSSRWRWSSCCLRSALWIKFVPVLLWIMIASVMFYVLYPLSMFIGRLSGKKFSVFRSVCCLLMLQNEDEHEHVRPRLTTTASVKRATCRGLGWILIMDKKCGDRIIGQQMLTYSWVLQAFTYVHAVNQSINHPSIRQCCQTTQSNHF